MASLSATRRATLGMLGLMLLAIVELGGRGAWADPAVAVAMPNEDAETRYLEQLCRDAKAGSPTDMRGLLESLAKSQEAIETAKALRAKHGRDPKGVNSPECDFIKRAPLYAQ